MLTASGNPSSYTIARLSFAINGPQIYKSSKIFQTPPPNSGAAFSFTPPSLPSGDYTITATAFDSVGFTNTITAPLAVRRLFGLFSVSDLDSHVNADSTTTFTARLNLENDTLVNSSYLRVRLIEIASASFRDQEGPPSLPAPAEPAQASVDPVSPLPAHGTEHIQVGAMVRGPAASGSNSVINFHVYAVLEENITGEWIVIDSLKIIDGVHALAIGGFSGPGGGVNDPPPTLNGSLFDPLILESVRIAGQANANHSTTTPYTTTATVRNSLGPMTANVTAYSAWAVAPAPPFTINRNGVLQPSNITADKPATISANFTLGGVMRMASPLAVTVHANPPVRGDFNADNFTDYVLFNPGNRSTAIWNLHGNTFLSGLYGPTPPAGWTLACVADVNRDSKPDYVLFKADTRQTALWYLNNNMLVGSAYGPTLPPDWRVIAVVDFNNDGKPDYVLFNPTTRRTAIWYLNGAAYVSAAYGPTLPANWTLRDAIDFNGNGKPDFLLANSNTRQTAIWYLNGAAYVSAAYGPTLPAGWVLQGAADFNADGKPDYVLLETVTRRTALWYLNGAMFVSSAYGPTLATNYTLAFPGAEAH